MRVSEIMDIHKHQILIKNFQDPNSIVKEILVLAYF